jgi:hypothetical protein
MRLSLIFQMFARGLLACFARWSQPWKPSCLGAFPIIKVFRTSGNDLQDQLCTASTKDEKAWATQLTESRWDQINARQIAKERISDFSYLTQRSVLSWIFPLVSLVCWFASSIFISSSLFILILDGKFHLFYDGLISTWVTKRFPLTGELGTPLDKRNSEPRYGSLFIVLIGWNRLVPDYLLRIPSETGRMKRDKSCQKSLVVRPWV